MYDVKKIELEFAKTIDYFSNHINGNTFLSNAIQNNVDLSKGYFYTFLPTNAKLNKIYDFNYGEILFNPHPQIIRKEIGHKDFIGFSIQTLDDFLCYFIYMTLNKNKSKRCIIHDYNSSYKDKDYLLSEEVFILKSHDEVYYLLNNEHLERKNILEIIRRANVYWYMLGIITKGIELKNNELSTSNLTSLYEGLEMIFTSAYDGEGYIFWEKKNR